MRSHPLYIPKYMSVPHPFQPQQPYILVDAPSKWEDCLKKVASEDRFALDLEADSLYAYQEKICLIQISIPKTDFIIDPLSGIDLQPLGNLIENGAIEKVLHSSEYDLMLMKRQFGWRMNNLFDTMWAARILGVKKMGLANILKEEFGIQLSKKFQKANWRRRPLADDKLRYAQLDTHFLLRLRHQLAGKLKKEGHQLEAEEIFREQAVVSPPDTAFSPDDFWQIHGVHRLSRRGQAVARELAIYRNKEGRRQNRPLFRIFSNKTIVELAQRMPASAPQINGVHGMTQRQINRYAAGIIGAVRQGKTAPFPAYPHKNKPLPKEISLRYDKLRHWRKNRAQQRGVESDVIMYRQTLLELAKNPPVSFKSLSKIKSLGAWRRQTYGAELIRLLNPEQEKK